MRMRAVYVCFLRVVHVLGSREWLQGPVKEAVDEDEACTACPDHQNRDEGHTNVIDHLLRETTHNKQIIL